MYFLRSAKNLLSQHALKSLYYSLIHCHLVYANIIWSAASQSYVNKLYVKQKMALRLITASKYNSHSEPLFKETKILPLPLLSTFFRLQFFQRYKQNFLPKIFENQWITNSERMQNQNFHNLRNCDDFYTPISRLKSFENFPLYVLPKSWNNLNDMSIKIIRDKIEFNYKLKEHLLNTLNLNYRCGRLLCPRCHL